MTDHIEKKEDDVNLEALDQEEFQLDLPLDDSNDADDGGDTSDNSKKTASPADDKKQQADDEPQLSEVEKQAYSQGWRPKEEFVAAGNDPSLWKEAGWWLDRGNLLGQQAQLRRELKQVKDAFIKMTEYNRNAYVAGQRDQLKQLKEERKAALKANDLDAVAEYDDRIEAQTELVQDVQKKLNEPVLPNDAPSVEQTAMYQNWLDQNPWYQKDKDMFTFANGVLARYLSENPKTTPEAALDYVSSTVRKRFPNEFSGTQKVSQPNVGGKGNRTTSDNSNTNSGNVESKFKAILNKLDPDSKRMALQMVRSGTITMNEYVRDFSEVA